MSKNLFFEPVRIAKAIRWLLLEQNLDGSWGKNIIDKVRWTANAVYSFHLLGLSAEFKPIKKAIEWLKKIDENHVEWYLRIPPLCAFGLKDWLNHKGDFNRIKQLFEKDSIGPLAIKSAIALDLNESGVSLPNINQIESSVLSTLREEDNDLFSFAGSTNDTSLYCDFLNTLFPKKHNDIIQKCLRWILIRKIENKDLNTICWEKSYGKTAYVILNLLKFIKQKPKIRSLLPQVLEYYRPSHSGAIPPDNFPAHESKSSIYTTILFIRVYAKISEYHLDNYRELSVFLLEGIYKNLLFKKYVYRFIFFLLSAICLTSIVYLVKYVLGKHFLIAILTGLIAWFIPRFFNWLYKIFLKLIRNIWVY
ncbi:unnamed protein product [marine sediment metagenome]|uniref:Squalene cyclase C-terminal domain-containing protein n=2 Tax=marine sediment metagenome TaxID=412755 RepID=X0YZU4_9ZZZZ